MKAKYCVTAAIAAPLTGASLYQWLLPHNDLFGMAVVATVAVTWICMTIIAE